MGTKDLDKINFKELTLDILRVDKKAIKEAQKNKFNELEKEKNAKSEEEFKQEVEKYSDNEIFGKYRDVDDRFTKLNLLVNEAVEGTKKGLYKKGSIFYMNRTHGNKLINQARHLLNYFEQVNELNLYNSVYTSDSVQPFFNGNMFTQDGSIKQDNTIESLRKTIVKINKLECICNGFVFDYSSTIKTNKELDNIYIKNENKKVHNSTVVRTFRDDDYNKIAEPIREKLRNRDKVYDYEIAFIIAGEFGLRKESIKGLTLDDLHANGTIDVYDYNNKSEETFLAKPKMFPDFEDEALISDIYKRTLDKNAGCRTSKKQVPIITSLERQLYKGFDTLLKKNGITTNYGHEKFRSVRRRYAQKLYDDCRLEIKGKFWDKFGDEEYNEKSRAALIAKVLVEVNYLMGHNPKHINTTIGYIDTIY